MRFIFLHKSVYRFSSIQFHHQARFPAGLGVRLSSSQLRPWCGARNAGSQNGWKSSLFHHRSVKKMWFLTPSSLNLAEVSSRGNGGQLLSTLFWFKNEYKLNSDNSRANISTLLSSVFLRVDPNSRRKNATFNKPQQRQTVYSVSVNVMKSS